MRHRIRNFSYEKSNGFVLITSSIFLIILTLIVVYSARSAIVSERGSSNMRNRSQAFQMAEFAQRWAMNQLIDVDSISFKSGKSGYIDSGSANLIDSGKYCQTDVASCNQVKGANNPGDTATKAAPTIVGVAEQPRFVIKDLGFGDGASTCTYYEISSRGVGFKSDSVVYLRSVVKAC